MSDEVWISVLQSSGPAGFAVFVLGWTIKHWFTDLKTSIKDLRERLDANTKSHTDLKGDLIRLQADVRDNARRLDAMDRLPRARAP